MDPGFRRGDVAFNVLGTRLRGIPPVGAHTVGECLSQPPAVTETSFADGVGSYKVSITTRRRPTVGECLSQPPAVTETSFADGVGSYKVSITTRRSPHRGRMPFPTAGGDLNAFADGVGSYNGINKKHP